ncbi:MAG: FAD-dependent oxidoreductase [Halofilum sp. (in: g-proteobacteria)]|nr:FAD-dependent oxidoreductase [Halofilum sp. (in: g-proteobacteria)]
MSARDVVIVGAGAVGATLALALARKGRDVVLLDARPGPAEVPGAEYAGFAVSLNRASSAVLARLGAWERIAATRVSPYGAMELRDAAGSGHTRFDSADIGEPMLGHFVEPVLVEACLHELLAAHPRVELRWGTRPESLDVGPRRAQLVLHDDTVLEAALAVGADGGRSRLRELAGIDTRDYDYGQQALVCHFATERPHGAVARQRFLPGGPVAMLPLADGRCHLAWFRPPQEAEELLALDDTDFARALSEATDYILGAVTAVTPRKGFPVTRRHAVAYIDRRVALVGDAAHTIHPLAGQGLNLGLLDAAALADAIGGDGDAGGWQRLRRYARWRRAHNTAVMSAMDFFHFGFAHGGPLRAAARNIGMLAADRSGFAKKMVTRHGAGLAGDLPPLARPLSVGTGTDNPL